MNRRLLHLFNTAIIISMLFSANQALCAPKVSPCMDREAHIEIFTGEGRMYLCKDGKSEQKHAVSIGKEGRGKKKEGDNKTPLGRYILGAPRASEDFHKFIPVDYPTEQQRKEGYTGGRIGIHGPHKSYAWLGFLNTLVDWTQGCIAVGTNADMDKVAEWVKQNKPVYVEIR